MMTDEDLQRYELAQLQAKGHEVRGLVESPAWHKRPTAPGLWVCWPTTHTYAHHHPSVLDLSQADLDRGAPFYCDGVFGPLPPRPEEPSNVG